MFVYSEAEGCMLVLLWHFNLHLTDLVGVLSLEVLMPDMMFLAQLLRLLMKRTAFGSVGSGFSAEN